MGRGVTKVQFPKHKPAPKEEENEKDEAPSPSADPNAKWLDRPSKYNQHIDMPDTVRHGKMSAIVFDLSDAKQLEEYNGIIEGHLRRGGPKYWVADHRKEFFEGKFYVYMEYAPLEYKMILDAPGGKK